MMPISPPVPELDALSAGVRARILAVQEKSGFVPDDALGGVKKTK